MARLDKMTINKKGQPLTKTFKGGGIAKRGLGAAFRGGGIAKRGMGQALKSWWKSPSLWWWTYEPFRRIRSC